MILPIEKSIPALVSALNSKVRVLLQAPPGSGKSTIVPTALLSEPWLAGKKILLLQPRRVAARSIATRMAELRNEKVGETIGYRIRFENKITASTRIEVLTEGILTRMIQADNTLEGVGLIIFDEFHERSIHADLALALTLELQETVREDLRVLLMSATLDANSLAAFLGDAAVLHGEGVPYPVDIRYLPDDPKDRIPEVVAREIARALREDEGDILAFLPGVGEIKQTAERIPSDSKLEICELFGEQGYEDQKRALFPNPQGRRKLILSTPIAETSLTIEGVHCVIDSGYMKSAKFDASYGINRLVTERISQDSAEQRAGRAGRLGPGVCRRLWSEHTQRMLAKCRVPEILQSDLTAFALELAGWRVSDPGKLRFLDLPRENEWRSTISLLTELGALDSTGQITPRGRELLDFPAHPRLGALLLEARKRDELALACDLAAILEERDIFRRDSGKGADLEERINALRLFRRNKKLSAVDSFQCARVDRTATYWARRTSTNLLSDDAERGAAGLLLSFAYPERIGIRREEKSRRYVLANGSGATLGEHDRLAKSECIVAAHMHVGSGDGKVFLAAEVDIRDLEAAHSERIKTEHLNTWDEGSHSVRLQERRSLGALVMSVKNTDPTRDEAEPILMAQVLGSGGVRNLDWTIEAERFHARAKFAKAMFSDPNLPDTSETALNAKLSEQLPVFLEKGMRLSEVKSVSALKYLESLFSWEQKQFLDNNVPDEIKLPNSRTRSITYRLDEAVLEASVQELFGWKETPKIAGGRVTLTLEILSPARRPVQVTKDLRGFWLGTYQDVRKELRGRYPKHPWPEDGLNAPPVVKKNR